MEAEAAEVAVAVGEAEGAGWRPEGAEAEVARRVAVAGAGFRSR